MPELGFSKSHRTQARLWARLLKACTSYIYSLWQNYFVSEVGSARGVDRCVMLTDVGCFVSQVSRCGGWPVALQPPLVPIRSRPAPLRIWRWVYPLRRRRWPGRTAGLAGGPCTLARRRRGPPNRLPWCAAAGPVPRTSISRPPAAAASRLPGRFRARRRPDYGCFYGARNAGRSGRGVGTCRRRAPPSARSRHTCRPAFYGARPLTSCARPVKTTATGGPDGDGW